MTEPGPADAEEPAAGGTDPAGSRPDSSETDPTEQPRRVRTRVRVRIPIEPTVHHWYRPRNVIGVPVLAVVLLVAAYLIYLNAQLSSIQRAPLLAEYAGARSIGTNVLLVGSEAAPGALAADPRTLVVQLVHLAPDATRAAVVNFPRDLLVTSPASHGLPRATRTIAGVYDEGGDPALVETLQADLGLSIDHVIQTSFTGYAKVTDRLGGVDLPTSEGVRHFSGAEALGYADARTGLAQGSIDTGHRHQQWLRAMIGAAVTPGVLLDPFSLIGLLHDATPSVIVDETFTSGAMRSLLWDCRHLSPSSIRYLTVPYLHFAQRRGFGRVLLPDGPAVIQLGAAIRADDQTGIETFDN